MKRINNNQNIVKTALITGASSGIGTEFARLLAAQGYNLILVSRNKDKLLKIKSDLEKSHKINISVIPFDLSQQDAADQLYQKCKKNRLHVDMLINNAGLGMFGQSTSIPTNLVAELINLNAVSLTNLCNVFAKEMVKKGQGEILNVGSLIGRQPAPYFSIYAASKSYVFNYSLALYTELKKQGITVTCLLPGFVRTNFDANAQIGSKKYREFSSKNSMTPERVAKIGLKGLFKKKPFIIAGFKNKFFYFLLGLVSPTVVARIINTFMTRFS
jgi:short-subunit dehydrogenase